MEQQLLKVENTEMETEIITINHMDPDITAAPVWLLALIGAIFSSAMFWFVLMVISRGAVIFDVLFFVTILSAFGLYMWKENIEEKGGDPN